MANPEHITLLKRSVAEWNEWRRDNPQVTRDLRGANLEDADLESANFEGANLERVWNLSCDQVNSIQSLDNSTRFPKYLSVMIISEVNGHQKKDVENRQVDLKDL